VNLRCGSETCCTRLAGKHSTQESRQKSPSGHHRTTLSGYFFATKAHIDNRKKLVKQRYVLHMSHNMVNFGPLAAEIGLPVCGTPANFNGFRVLAALLHSSQLSSERQPNFAALNRGHHLCSAGRPSRWALAHMLIKTVYCRGLRTQKMVW